jgi:hypothetical protein
VACFSTGALRHEGRRIGAGRLRRDRRRDSSRVLHPPPVAGTIPAYGPDQQQDFGILRELKARGATEFLALPIPSPFGFGRYMVALAIARHGGEILKFIGDGLLAIFPTPTADDAPRATANALAAARKTLAALVGRTLRRRGPLRIAVALHYGSVIYGNIGAIGPPRFHGDWSGGQSGHRIEAVAKSLDLPLVVSDDFVAA